VEILVDGRRGSEPVGLVLGADGNFYGTTSNGGAEGGGTFFRVTPGGAFTKINDLPSRPFSYFGQQLVLGGDGNFYDRTLPQPDTVMQLTPTGLLTTIADLTAAGAPWPYQGDLPLVSAADGNLYGVTSSGGANGRGTAFKLTTSGTLTFIADFDVPDSGPAELINGGDGNFYGLITSQHYPSQEAAFKMTPAGEVTIIHVFDPANLGPDHLAVGSDGNLYGTTAADNARTLFRLTRDGTFTVLNTVAELFAVDVHLVLAPDGNFYVARSSEYNGDGTFSPGSIHRISMSGELTTIVPQSAGLYPDHLLLGPDGNLYGTLGSSAGSGAIFRCTLSGEVTTVYAFPTPISLPSPLCEGPDGNFYGVTPGGGLHLSGTVFRMQPNGTVAVLAEFDGANGSNPRAGLTLGTDNNFYGTTYGGAGPGTVFRITPAAVLTSLVTLDGHAIGRLVEGSDGAFYGTTEAGSASNGTVFKVTTNGTLTTVLTLPQEAGAPAGGVALGSDGNFFGLTQGTSTESPTGPRSIPKTGPALYRVTANGEFSIVHQFPINTSIAQGDLVRTPGGELYALLGGDGEFLARLNSDDTVTTLFVTTHYTPYQSFQWLTAGSDGNLYLVGGDGGGARFARAIPDGIVSTVARIDTSSYNKPSGPLVQASDGRFYGASGSGRISGIYRASLLAPKITAISPGNPATGSKVTITGSSFFGATRVSFGGLPAASFTVDSDTQISAALPSGATAAAVSITTPAGIATFPAGSVPPGGALNISTRIAVGTGDDALIGGFIVRGNAAKKVIIRAIGPSLAAAGVEGVLNDPLLELHDGTGKVIATNGDWQTSADKQAIVDTGIAPSDMRESAIVQSLDPGSYTAVIRGAGDTKGVALVEVYDLDRAAGRLSNISTRGHVQTGDQVMIGGFIVGGDAPGKVLIRAIGPSLGKASPPVGGVLADPQVELRDGDGDLMAANDNWEDNPQREDISATGIAPSDPHESAIVGSLNPGNYTAIVRGVDDSTGVALIEVYDLGSSAGAGQ
jgi:uncharacterized repeat protein (TIGR03803 family)